MLRAITHYEQVSLESVMKIFEQDNPRLETEESRAKNEKNRNTVLAPNSAKGEGAKRDS
jgi:hypothetical protein